MKYLTPIRWRDDTGWEYRCGDCADRNRECFWPLTDEFWDRKRTMRRCRSCQAALDARRARERYHRSTTVQERKREASRRYHRATRQAQRIRAKQKWAEVLADPARHAQEVARSRESSRRYREKTRMRAGRGGKMTVVGQPASGWDGRLHLPSPAPHGARE